MRKPTIKQLWARERNWTIGGLKGIAVHLRGCMVKTSTTNLEGLLMKNALEKIEEVLLYQRLERRESFQKFQEEHK